MFNSMHSNALQADMNCKLSLLVCLFVFSSLLVSSFTFAAILDQVIRWQIIPKQWGNVSNLPWAGNVSNLPWALMAAQRKEGAREDLRVEGHGI